MKTMKALVDGVKAEFRGTLRYENGVPVSNHETAINVVLQQSKGRENFKVITCGCVYVFNYNPATYKPEKPETFAEYLEMKEKGEWDGNGWTTEKYTK